MVKYILNTHDAAFHMPDTWMVKCILNTCGTAFHVPDAWMVMNILNTGDAEFHVPGAGMVKCTLNTRGGISRAWHMDGEDSTGVSVNVGLPPLGRWPITVVCVYNQYTYHIVKLYRHMIKPF